jgi:hypothetical protein
MRVLSNVERRIERERTGAQRHQRASQHDAQRDHGLPSSLHPSHAGHVYFIISPETVAFSSQLSHF